LFKSLYLSISAGAISRVLPEARFLILHRDLVYFIQSTIRGRVKNSGQDWWSVKPPNYMEGANQLIWQQVTRQIFYADKTPHLSKIFYSPERTMEIDYYELCQDPRETLELMKD
jgi:hypothetical protein